MRLSQGLLTLPPGGDIVAFVRHDGTMPPSQILPDVAVEPTLADLRDRYLETHGNGTLEPHTLRGIRRHFRHLGRLLGEGFPIRKLSLADLQGYVDKRGPRPRAGAARSTRSPSKKEIVTLRTAWNWGVRMKIVSGRYPYDGLRYPKSDEKPPFQTRAEIERQLPGLPPKKAAELWEALYLTLPEIDRLLTHVEEQALHPWIYPLVATAAHTGARKGELLRMRIGDVDFAGGIVSIQERKRLHGRRTTRRVPLSTQWQPSWPTGCSRIPVARCLFVQAEEVRGARSAAARPAICGRTGPGRVRHEWPVSTSVSALALCHLTEDEFHGHLKRTLKGCGVGA